MIVGDKSFSSGIVSTTNQKGVGQVTQVYSSKDASIGENNSSYMETSHEYASKGVAGAGLGLGM